MRPPATLEKNKLNKFSPADYNLQTKILWWLTLCLGSLIVVWATFGIFSFSAAQLVALPVALLISWFLNQHQFTIPRTRITFTANKFVVLWGIIWLGVPGGALLAAGASAAQYAVSKKDKRVWLFNGFVNIIAALAAGNVFYFFLKIAAGFGAPPLGEHALGFGWLMLTMLFAAATHYAATTLLTSIFHGFNDERSIADFWRDDSISSLGKYSIGVVAALILHLTFLEFGIYFGLVLLPIAAFSHLAYRLHLARFAQKTKEITEASRIHLATVEALATAIDARDQVGVGHVRRTQIYAVGIGELLHLSAPELEALNTGALLHDIGKLAVPDHILNKPGQLTPAEMEKTKIHAAVGASILENVNFPYPVVPTVKYHHEAWDGSGYPENLKGDKIPLTARILAVADSYDTLRGARPFRAAVSRDEARRFLLAGAGTQFDPKIVDVFLRHFNKFEAEIEAQGLSYELDGQNGEAVLNNTEDRGEQSYVEQIKRANREVFALYELARVFSSSLELPETLSLFVKKIGELVPFETCIVYLMDETQEFAKAAYLQGENSQSLKNKRVQIGEGATGYVLRKRKAAHKIEPGLDFKYNEFDFSRRYKAMASLPLIADEKLLGAVSLYSCELANYEEEHMRLLETVSRIAADAISGALQHAESESLALTDPMTNLPNARSLQLEFDKEAGRAGRNGTNFQLMMLDLDGFKAVNDTFGHKTGDKLLKELARVLTAQLRDYDFLARYAGDEFVALVPETDDEEIKELSQRIEKAVYDFVLPIGEDKAARVGISIGAASYPADGDSLEQVLVAADKAMYRVKSTRKTREITRVLPPLSEILPCDDFVVEEEEESIPENFIVELDESHIVSSAIN